MPSKDGTMDDKKKTTKGVVNKKQKQMLNQEQNDPIQTALKTATGGIKKIGTKVKSPNMTPDALQRFYKSSTGAASPLDNSHELKGKLIDEEEYDRYRDRIAMAGGDHRSKETRERSNTPTGKQPKGKTVMQKELEKKYGKGKSALDMVKADHKGEIMDVKKKKDKDVKEGAGLYANIHAKRKRGGKMRKKGAKGAPSAKDFANAAKTAREELDLTQVAETFGGHIIGKPVELNEDGGVLTIPATAAAIKYGIPAALAIGAGAYDYYKKRKGERGIFPDISKVLSNVFAAKKNNKNTTSNTGDNTSDSENVKVDKNNKKNKNEPINPIIKKYKKRPEITGDVTKQPPVITGDVTKVNPIKKELQKNVKKVSPKEINKKLKTVKNPKGKTNVDSQSNVTDNPLKDALTKVDKKTLKKVGTVTGVGAPIVGGTVIGVNQLIKNQPELLANTPKNNKKTKIKTKKKDDSKRPRLPGVPRLDQGVIGQRTAG